MSSIASTGTSSSGVVSYTVYLALKNAPDTIKPGQSGSVSVITAESDNTLYVPSTAVTTAGGVSTVTVVNGKSRTRTVVTLGTVGDSTTAIKSGLTKGQTGCADDGDHRQLGFPTGGFPVTRGGTGTLTGGGGGGGLVVGPAALMAAQPVIEISRAVKTYGEGETAVHALRGVDLVVERGDYVAIMGASGLRQVDADEHPRLPRHA